MATPIIQVTNLYKTYRLGKVDVPVLRGATLSVEEGETVAILGASGSGKSTLLHLMGGLDRADRPGQARRRTKPEVCDACGGTLTASKDDKCPACGTSYLYGPVPMDAGGVLFRGQVLSMMSAGALDQYRGRSVGFVFQFYHLLPELTVLQNVLAGAMAGLGPIAYLTSRRSAVARARELLARVGLGHRLSHRPSQLSGGERQRVAIARGLVNTPALLLADEPTGNLDRKTGGTILDLLHEIRRETRQSMVIVTHDEHTAQRADRTISLVDGRVQR
ncbi:MAG TPA: ABC transporter ATP-binding protein [Phycisphaerales bacterium]|nr:ABC transporter ATP-binding protein [Phycisphaerales bacterium]